MSQSIKEVMAPGRQYLKVCSACQAYIQQEEEYYKSTYLYRRWDVVGTSGIHKSKDDVIRGALEYCVVCFEVVRLSLSLEDPEQCKRVDGSKEVPKDVYQFIRTTGEEKVKLKDNHQFTVEIVARSSIDIYIRATDIDNGQTVADTIARRELNELDDLDAINESLLPGPLRLGRCKEQLDFCSEKHYYCASGPAWSPTRLLLLQDDTAVLINTTDVSAGPYATLSHCWGLEPFMTLNASTATMLKRGVPINDFLPNFRDAMNIALALDFKYIWIDCYCIVQDDPQDWDRESQVMHWIYTCGTVNIGAADSVSPHTGLLTHRAKDIQIAITEKYALIADRHVWTGCAGFLDSQLLSRGWVLQERLLCRRMIYFTRFGIWWECADASHCIEGIMVSTTGIDERKLRNFQLGVGRLAVDCDLPPSHWYELVYMYSRTQLTYPAKDKRRAIEGVLKRMEHLTGEEYYFGHALPDIIWSLLWFHDYGFDCEATRSPCKVPTWSWLSMQGHVAPSFHRRQPCAPLAMVFGLPDVTPLICIGRLLSVPSSCFSGAEKRSYNDAPIELPSGIRLNVILDYPGELGESFFETAKTFIMPSLTSGFYRMLVLSLQADGTYHRLGVAGAEEKWGSQRHPWPHIRPSLVMLN